MSDEQLDLISHVDPAPAIQTHRFAVMMAAQLRRLFPDLGCYNFVPIQDFPVGRRLWFGRMCFERDGYKYQSLPFVNLLVFKHLTRFASLFRRRRELGGYNFLVVHGLHMPNLAFAAVLRRAGVRVGVILTDEHGIVLSTDGLIRRALKRLDRQLVQLLCARLDFGIALSPALAAMYVPGKPTMILPGIYNEALAERVSRQRVVSHKRDRRFRAVYFGGLSTEYGVQALLDALPNLAPGVELRLFGRGPLEVAIAERAVACDALHWGGLIGEDELAAEMGACSLLINARAADGRLAQLSSPSKLLEYAASGKPVATTPLPTIPSSVMDCCLCIDESSGVAVAQTINRAASMPAAQLKKFGLAFQQEMRARYNADALSQAFIELFDAVTSARPVDFGRPTKHYDGDGDVPLKGMS